MMGKNRFAFYLILTIVLVNIFNIVFILLALKGPEHYYKQILAIFKNYFAGLPTALYGICVLFLLFFQLLKKWDFSHFLTMNMIVFLLFVVSFNLVLFPQLNQMGEYGASSLLTLKTKGSLNEAIQLSPASYTEKIKEYKEIDRLLKKKVFIVPLSDPLKDDFYFSLFVKPSLLMHKKYNFILPEETFERMNKNNYKVIRAFLREGRIYAYFIFEGAENSNEIFLFVYRRFCLLIPSQMAQELL